MIVLAVSGFDTRANLQLMCVYTVQRTLTIIKFICNSLPPSSPALHQLCNQGG